MKKIKEAIIDYICLHIVRANLFCGIFSILGTFFITEFFGSDIKNGNLGAFTVFQICFLFILAVSPIILNQFEKHVITEFNSTKNINTELSKNLQNYKKIFRALKKEICSILQPKMHEAAQKLSFNGNINKSDRITIYRDLGDGTLFILGRYSRHGTYRNIDPEKKYPINKGAIGKGYECDFFMTKGREIPDPVKQNSKYIDHLIKKYNFTSEEVKNINMPCRFFAVKRINNSSQILGVIVIESLEPNRFKEQEVKSVFEDLIREVKSMFIIWSKEAEMASSQNEDKSAANDEFEYEYTP